MQSTMSSLEDLPMEVADPAEYLASCPQAPLSISTLHAETGRNQAGDEATEYLALDVWYIVGQSFDPVLSYRTILRASRL